MRKEDLIKTKNDTDFTSTVRSVYLKTVNQFGITSRITNLLDMIKRSYDIKEWTYFDATTWQIGSFTSYLVDVCKEFFEGKPVNFSQLYRDILKVGDFTEKEKILLEDGDIEERLWAMFLAIYDPTNKKLNIS